MGKEVIKWKDVTGKLRDGSITKENVNKFSFLITYQELMNELKRVEKETKKQLKETLNGVANEFELMGDW